MFCVNLRFRTNVNENVVTVSKFLEVEKQSLSGELVDSS